MLLITLHAKLPPYTSANVIVDATEATERNISYGEQKISKAAQNKEDISCRVNGM